MVRLVILLLLNLWALSSLAQQQSDVYRAEAIVANQSEAERINAAKATIGDVIVRVTGDVTALQHPLIRQAINEAPNFLLRFSYTSERDVGATGANPSNSKVSNAGVSKDATGNLKPDRIKLILNYSPQTIEKLLADAQLLQRPLQQAVLIQIVNVQDFSAFKQAQAYLKTVSLIQRSELLSIHKDVLVFSVMAKGDVSLLKTALELNSKWQAVEATDMDAQALPAQPSQLIFRWLYPS
ncbi:MAG: DUF2066 domain-containing protein [Pseudomonadota bacterium]